MNNTRKSVLILVYQDGWIEAFADKSVAVKIVNVPFIGSIEGEIAAEKHLEKTLPFRYREIFWPNNKRASHLLRKVLPSDIKRAKWEMAFLTRLSKMKDEVAV